MPPTIRPAVVDDAPFIAWVQQEASRSHLPYGFWDLAFPGSDEYRLGLVERVVRTDAQSFAHWSRFLIAEVDGEPAAGLSAYDHAPDTTGPLFLEALVAALGAEGWNEARLGGMQQRLVPFLTCAPDQPEETWIVEWVATRPEHRGKGLVRALLRAILDAGRERGYQTFQIGVLIGNIPAQRAYESAGFAVVDEKRHPDFEAAVGAPGIRRMQRGR
jgi:translation initiation factor 4G